MNPQRLLSVSILLLLVHSASAQNPAPTDPPPPVFSVGTGFDFSRGDYGLATDTEVISVPLTLGYEQGAWLLEVRAPWLRIEGPATVVAGGGGSPTRPTAAAETGLGDISVSGTHRFGAVLGAVHAAATVRAKLPTGSEGRGLGTGGTDFAGQLDFFRNFGTVTPFASLGYSAFGDGDFTTLEDGPYATAGAHFRTGEATLVTTAYSWRHRYVSGGEHGQDALLAVTHDLNARWRVMAYVLTGFSDASPDLGGGLHLSARF